MVGHICSADVHSVIYWFAMVWKIFIMEYFIVSNIWVKIFCSLLRPMKIFYHKFLDHPIKCLEAYISEYLCKYCSQSQIYIISYCFYFIWLHLFLPTFSLAFYFTWMYDWLLILAIVIWAKWYNIIILFFTIAIFYKHYC